MKINAHIYTKKEEIIINYLYKYGIDSLLFTKEKISKLFNISIDALTMKISNHKSADGNGTFDHYSKMVHDINNVMRNISQEKQKKMVMTFLLKMHKSINQH